MDSGTSRTILLIIMALTTLCTSAFPVCYLRFPWRRTAIGRALMIKSSSTAITTGTVFTLLVFHVTAPIRLVIYGLLFGIISTASLHLTYVMLRINRRRSVADKEEAYHEAIE